jgi:chromosome partitioning protein
MQRIVVLNPKGGSGKSTIAMTLASYFAQRGEQSVLIDYDPQGSSARWVKRRDPTRNRIHLINACEINGRATRSFQMRIPAETTRVIIDTPAAVGAQGMAQLTRGADKIVVPVMPSEVDIHACSRCVASLLLVAKVNRAEHRLGIVANRVRYNTQSYQALLRFLHTLGIPLLTTIRDSQNYVRSAETGVGLHEMKPHLVADDLPAWTPLLDWLEEPPRQAVLFAPVPAPLGLNAVM